MNTEDTIQSKYLPTIGLEIHTELKTSQRCFADAKTIPLILIRIQILAQSVWVCRA